MLYIEQAGTETSNVAKLASILLQCIVPIRSKQTLSPIPGTFLLLSVDFRTDEKTKKITNGNSEFGESCTPGSSRIELTFVPRFLADKKRSHSILQLHHNC